MAAAVIAWTSILALLLVQATFGDEAAGRERLSAMLRLAPDEVRDFIGRRTACAAERAPASGEQGRAEEQALRCNQLLLESEQLARTYAAKQELVRLLRASGAGPE